MNIEVIQADYLNPDHQQDLISLLDGYAQDPMGGSEPLQSHVKQGLCDKLADVPGAFSLICYVDGKPVGLANCFMGFSTFKAKPLVNIHDMAVDSSIRSQGIGQALLKGVEHIARERGCCKITLEVLEGNLPAQGSYKKFGFEGYELDPKLGKALFWEKPL